MVATSGDRLLAAEAVDGLRTKLIPQALLLTPNLPEAAALLDEPVAASAAAIESQGRRLLAMGCQAVLIKGFIEKHAFGRSTTWFNRALRLQSARPRERWLLRRARTGPRCDVPGHAGTFWRNRS